MLKKVMPFWLRDIQKITLAILLGVFLPVHQAHAFVEWLGKVIIGGIIWIVLVMPVLVGQAAATLAGNLLLTVADPGFITKRYTEISFVKEGFQLCFNLGIIFMVLGLIAIGLAIALRLIKDPKEALIKFILAGLMMPFGGVFAGFMIDFSNVFTKTFFETGAASGVIGGVSLFSAACDSFSAMFAPGAGFLEAITGLIVTLLFLAVYGYYTALVLARFAILFFARFVALWLIIMFSPLVFAFYALSTLPGNIPVFQVFSKLSEYYKKWWQSLFEWCFIGMIGSIFLYIAGITSMSLLGAEEDLVQGGFFTELLGENILPFLIPLIIIHMGYKMTLEWAPASARGIINTVEAGAKMAVMAAGGAVAGLGASAMGSKTAMKAMSKTQAWGAKMSKKKGLGAFGYAVNRASTSLKGIGAGHNKRMKTAAEKRMKKIADIDDGESLANTSIHGTRFNQRQTEINKKAKDKILHGVSKAEYGKDKVKEGDPRYMDLLRTSVGERDTETIIKMFRKDPNLMKSTDPISRQAKEAISGNKAKDNAEKIRISTKKGLGDLTKEQEKGLDDILDVKGSLSEDKNITGKKLNKLGFNDEQKQTILEAKEGIGKGVLKDSVGTVYKRMTPDDISNLDYNTLLNPDVIQGLAKGGSNQSRWAGIKRGGADFMKQLMHSMDPEQKFMMFRSLKQDDMPSPDLMNSKEFIKGMANNGMDNKDLTNKFMRTTDKTGFKELLSHIKNDEVKKTKLFSGLEPATINKLSDNILKSSEMIQGILLNMKGKKNAGLTPFLEHGGPEYASMVNHTIEHTPGLKSTIAVKNPDFFRKQIFTPSSVVAGIRVNKENGEAYRPTDRIEMSKYIAEEQEKHYQNMSGQSQEPPKEKETFREKAEKKAEYNKKMSNIRSRLAKEEK